MTEGKTETLSDQMTERFGPIIGGKDLYAALGFKTYSSFHRVKQLGELGVDVFSLPGRKGWFAKTVEVAAWIEKHAREK